MEETGETSEHMVIAQRLAKVRKHALFDSFTYHAKHHVWYIDVFDGYQLFNSTPFFSSRKNIELNYLLLLRCYQNLWGRGKVRGGG